MKRLCKLILPIFALLIPLAVAAPADAYVSSFQIYTIQAGAGGAVVAHGTAPSVVAVAVRVFCSNSGTVPHYGPRKYVAYDPSQYVCAGGAYETGIGYVFYYS